MEASRLLITRPEPDASRVAAELEVQGIEAIKVPMMDVSYEPAVVDMNGYQAVIVTSAHAIRALVEQEVDRHLPLYAVGDHTAEEATKSGWEKVMSAGGNNEDLVKLIEDEITDKTQPLLYVSGDKVMGDIHLVLANKGFEVTRQIVYRMIERRRLPDVLLQSLDEVDGVLFYSSRTAGVFSALLKKHAIETSIGHMVAYCMSEQVCNALKNPEVWADIVVANA